MMASINTVNLCCCLCDEVNQHWRHPHRKFCPPPLTRIYKVIMQEMTATMVPVLYILPVVEPIICVNDSAIIIVAGNPFHSSMVTNGMVAHLV